MVESPESKLWLAVLIRAIQDFKSKTHLRDAQDAGDFIFSTEQDSNFRAVCLAAGFEPDYIRKSLRKWIKAQCGEQGGWVPYSERRLPEVPLGG